VPAGNYNCIMVQMSKHRAKRSDSCCGGLRDLLSPKLFKALSDPRRLALLIRLAEAGEPRTVGVVADGSGVDMSVVSRHLAILREAGIIQCEKRGKEVWCVVQTGAVVKVLRDLADALEACCPVGWRIDVSGSADIVKRRAAGTARTR
jgi:ArsR family transcriptional regulator, arsenate/arsenite/antimonite-responsive transcriptional repressor